MKNVYRNRKIAVLILCFSAYFFLNTITFAQESSKVIVISFDGGEITAGFAEEKEPSVIIPAIVGESGVGEEARNGKFTYPIYEGKINHWKNFEALLHHVYEQLEVESNEYPVLISELPITSKEDSEHLKQMMFETFDVPACLIENRAVLALYASGRTQGLVLELGWDRCYAVAIYEGLILPHSIKSLDAGQLDIIDYMNKLLTDRGDSPLDQETIYDILEKLCYVAEDFYTELAKTSASSELSENYELPDGNTITIQSERFRVLECLFKPAMLGIEQEGIHHIVYESTMRCDLDIRGDLLRNMVLIGSNSMHDNIEIRLTKELRILFPQSMSNVIKITASSERKFAPWIGGSIVANTSAFEKMCTTKEQYEASHKNNDKEENTANKKETDDEQDDEQDDDFEE